MADKSKSDEVEIPKEVMEQLEQAPSSRGGQPRATFEPWQDAVLLKYWKEKRQDDVSEIVGWSRKICQRRYQQLVKEQSSS